MTRICNPAENITFHNETVYDIETFSYNLVGFIYLKGIVYCEILEKR